MPDTTPNGFNLVLKALNSYHSLRYPAADKAAADLGLTSSQLDDIFTEWAGVSFGRFLHDTSISNIKTILPHSRRIITGHDPKDYRPANIERITRNDYSADGRLEIGYGFHDTPLGRVIIGSTKKGICHVAFTGDDETALAALESAFPNAVFRHTSDGQHDELLNVLRGGISRAPVKLHVEGTDFQIKVWDFLLNIPSGALATYGDIAARIGSPGSSRAVGNAVGANPAAYIIPCHRVVRSSGALGGYRWGTALKHAITGYEIVSATLPGKELF